MAKKKSPQVLATVLIATSIATISYKVYEIIKRYKDGQDEAIERSKENNIVAAKPWSTDKSIALTLLHSVLSSDLPLEDILLSSGNVTFILPPYLSIDDIACHGEKPVRTRELPQTLMDNYKLLQCLNIDGYFHLVKNLKPEILVVCSDDLGIRDRMPPDLTRFVKEIVYIDQDKMHVHKVLSKVFLK